MRNAVGYLLIFDWSIFLFAVFGGLLSAPRTDLPAYTNPKLPVEQRAEDLLKRMTLEEKIALLGGTGFTTQPIARLGIPALKMTDGPLGVRWGKSTAFPAGTCMAASFDTSMMFQVGKAIAEEVKGKGRDEILGPCVNIARIPMGGRTFEGYGEEPYLVSRMAVSYIEGVQSEGVAATVKHYAANNQEYERMFVDEKISKRALNEIYLPAFKASVEEAHVLAVMAAYNKVNGYYCTESDYLLSKKLKDDWGFKGLVMSDWGAVHSSIPVANGGMDLEMPTGQFLNDSTLLPAIKSGEVKESTIDDKVRRILRVIFELGLFDHTRTPDSTLVNTPEHQRIAYRAAVEGIVLLKNENGILPLDLKKIKSIAVIGPNAEEARTTGGGSAMVDPIYSISPLEAFRHKLGSNVAINYAPGVTFGGTVTPIDSTYLYLPGSAAHGASAEYFDNMKLAGEPKVTRVDHNVNFIWNDKSPADGIPAVGFSARWMTRVMVPVSGDYSLKVVSDDGVRAYVDGKVVIDNWSNHGPEARSYGLHMDKGKFYDVKIEYYQDGGGAMIRLGLTREEKNAVGMAVAAAKKSDVAILFVGTSAEFETEGRDRDDLALPEKQDELIKEVCKANKHTIVVMITGAPVLMNGWINDVPGLVQAWFGGDESGNAVADVLLGKHDPSGRLPITFPVKWSDCSAHSSYKNQDSVSAYSDDIYVGYRWFDKHDIKPLFPFGYGLSYTKFSYSGLRITSLGNEYDVTFKVTNDGKVGGVEIPQLYVHDPDPAADAPVKELKKFDRVSLKPGETAFVRFTLGKSDFAHYDPAKDKWVTRRGMYEVMIGSSSRDIRLHGTLKFR